MEKYAKQVGSGRDYGKRKSQLESMQQKPSKKVAVSEKLSPTEKEISSKISVAEFKLMKGSIYRDLVDFKSIFDLIPTFQKLLATDVENFNSTLPMTLNEKQIIASYLSPTNSLTLKTLRERITNYSNDYPGGIKQAIYDRYPYLIEFGFQQNILAKQELKRIANVKLFNPNYFHNTFELFWRFYGDDYDPPIITIKDFTTINVDLATISQILRFHLEKALNEANIFYIPLYQMLVTTRLRGRSSEDIAKENRNLSKVLSRKLFSATSKKMEVHEVCFAFKSKLNKNLSTPSLTFLRTIMDNLHNQVLLESSNDIGLLIKGLIGIPNIESFVDIFALESDCQNLYSKKDGQWTEKRSQHKEQLASFLEAFIDSWVLTSTKIKADRKKSITSKLFTSSGNRNSFRNVCLVLSEMLIGELELRHQGYICFYSARNNGLTGIAIESEQLANEIHIRNPDIDPSKTKLLFSELVEGTCYRSTAAKVKPAIEIITQQYKQPFEVVSDSILSNFKLGKIVDNLRKTNVEIAKRKGETTSFRRWKRQDGQFILLWVLVEEKTVQKGAQNWYILLSLKGEEDPIILDVTFSEPSILKAYSTLQSEKKNPQFQPIRYETEIQDHDAVQRDRLRSANMSFFANLTDPGESTFVFFLSNASIANVSDLYDHIMLNQSLRPVGIDLKWADEALLETPKTAFKEFNSEQNQYLGTILRFAFPCNKVQDFVYASLPYGKPIRTKEQLKINKRIFQKTAEFYDVDQFIRYLTVPRIFTSEKEASRFQKHQVRILDLCFTTVAVDQGVKLELFKFYPQNHEEKLRKTLKSFYESIRQ